MKFYHKLLIEIINIKWTIPVIYFTEIKMFWSFGNSAFLILAIVTNFTTTFLMFLQ